MVSSGFLLLSLLATTPVGAAKNRPAGAPAFVNHVVLCEAAWVLARTYRYSRRQIHDALATILATSAFVVPERDLVEEAMRIFRATRADFADVLLGVLNRHAGCATTFTFDRRAAATAEFTAVG